MKPPLSFFDAWVAIDPFGEYTATRHGVRDCKLF